MNSDKILKTAEVAQLLGISERSVHNYTSKYGLPFHQIEGRKAKFYLESEILDYIRRM